MKPHTLTLEHAIGAIDIMDWCKTHHVPWNHIEGRCWMNVALEHDCVKARVLIVEVEPQDDL